MSNRLDATSAATALIRRVKQEHGPVLFHLSSGCCEGTAPICLRQSDFQVGPRDVLLGSIEDCPFYVGPEQFSTLAGSELTLDVIEGGGDSFSLEAGEGQRFIACWRLMTPQG